MGFSTRCFRPNSITRSAPASPSHTVQYISGIFTPDSLSREGSPAPVPTDSGDHAVLDHQRFTQAMQEVGPGGPLSVNGQGGGLWHLTKIEVLPEGLAQYCRMLSLYSHKLMRTVNMSDKFPVFRFSK